MTHEEMSAEFDRVQKESPVDTNQPHGWIQWKGTNVCIDLRCECGADGHLDGDFVYAVKCGKCGAIYALDAHVKLIPTKPGYHEPKTFYDHCDECNVAPCQCAPAEPV